MDTKNVIAAISLSAAVIILYSLFFAPPVVDQKNISNDKNTSSQNSSSDAPSLVQDEKIIKISRDEALEENERIVFENDKIKGSISLLGSSIDDLTFKNYTKTLNHRPYTKSFVFYLQSTHKPIRILFLPYQYCHHLKQKHYQT